jgi:hypothetical protein
MWGSIGDGDMVRRRNGSHSDLPGENMLKGLGLAMKVGWRWEDTKRGCAEQRDERRDRWDI